MQTSPVAPLKTERSGAGQHITIPPVTLIRNRLEKLSRPELQALANDSGVPFSTIQKIMYGISKNPGIETVRQFFPLLPS